MIKPGLRLGIYTEADHNYPSIVWLITIQAIEWKIHLVMDLQFAVRSGVVIRVEFNDTITMTYYV